MHSSALRRWLLFHVESSSVYWQSAWYEQKCDEANEHIDKRRGKLVGRQVPRLVQWSSIYEGEKCGSKRIVESHRCDTRKFDVRTRCRLRKHEWRLPLGGKTSGYIPLHLVVVVVVVFSIISLETMHDASGGDRLFIVCLTGIITMMRQLKLCFAERGNNQMHHYYKWNWSRMLHWLLISLSIYSIGPEQVLMRLFPPRFVRPYCKRDERSLSTISSLMPAFDIIAWFERDHIDSRQVLGRVCHSYELFEHIQTASRTVILFGETGDRLELPLARGSTSSVRWTQIGDRYRFV